MPNCDLGYIPTRLHENERLPIEAFSIGEFLYRRCSEEDITNPYAKISIVDLSHNRSGVGANLLSLPNDVLYNIRPEDEIQIYNDKIVCTLRIASLTTDHKYVKQFEEEKDGHTNISKLELLHEPESCMYPHCIFKVWVNGVHVNFDNYKDTLKKFTKMRNSIKEELASMIIQRIVSQDIIPNSG